MVLKRINKNKDLINNLSIYIGNNIGLLTRRKQPRVKKIVTKQNK